MIKKANISIISNNKKTVFKVNIEIKNNKISYKEELDNKVTDVLYDIDKKILIRDNKEIYMEYNFTLNKGSIYIKELKSEVFLDIKTKKIKDGNNRIDIEYIIDNVLYRYMIDME